MVRHQLDSVEILNAASETLGRLEQSTEFCRERVAPYAHALAVDNEIAEGERQTVRAEVQHIATFRGGNIQKFGLQRGIERTMRATFAKNLSALCRSFS